VSRPKILLRDHRLQQLWLAAQIGAYTFSLALIMLVILGFLP